MLPNRTYLLDEGIKCRCLGGLILTCFYLVGFQSSRLRIFVVETDLEDIKVYLDGYADIELKCKISESWQFSISEFAKMPRFCNREDALKNLQRMVFCNGT